MKKLLLFSVAVLMACACTSCKKDYTCECKFTDGTPNITAPFENAKKTDATEACDLLETTYKMADPTVTCTLK